MKYQENLEVLTALISHLALTAYKSRAPSWIAKSIGLDAEEVNKVLSDFRGIFRRSSRTTKDGEHFYTLQIRYATRTGEYEPENGKQGEAPGSPVDIADVMALLDHVGKLASQEQVKNLAVAELNQSKDLQIRALTQNQQAMFRSIHATNASIKQAKSASNMTLCVAIIGAIAAITAAAISAANQ